MRKIQIKAFVALFVGALLSGTAFGNYCYRLAECCEMTFLSNAAVGAVFLFSGARMLVTGNDVPQFLFLDCASVLASVVVMCAVFAPEVCFTGTGIMPHIVTPAVVICFWYALCDGRKCGVRDILSALAFPLAYYIFMILFGRVTGKSVYIYFDSNAMDWLKLALLGCAALALLAALSAFLAYSNAAGRAVATKRKNRSGSVATEECATDEK